MIATPARLAACWAVAALGVAALSAVAWSGDARPWDGVELWQWSVALTVAGAVAAVAAVAGPVHHRVTAATVGAVLTVVATAMWLREWWLIAHPASRGWWTFADDGDVEPITVAISGLHHAAAPNRHLTVAGYATGGLLLVALVAACAAVIRLARRPDQSPAG